MAIRKTYHRKKIFFILLVCLAIMLILGSRLVYLMIFKGDYYQKKAVELHERERDIKAKELGISVEACKKRVQRAKQKLRKILEDMDTEQ